MTDGDDCAAISGMNDWQRKPKYSREACPSAILSITDIKSLDPGSNQGRRGREQATSLLSYGQAVVSNLVS
jgi:hypothetical protein